ncbi:LysM peptidoglycan-binding domain-containing protein [Ligilactobacillus ruminis]|uniref:aggregation-promoting factor n=1 Tax=Ligilactobacillus ruminis TaxID=1623 RepID=UPI002659C68F|nr:LysM peptidoglycan-binding domain-containing protein [Ligilactobacillus ruminis]WKB71147.1 LysM peptidoglycan-binding domain-containing protein [Ligilactobacillus ruminis]
MKFNKVALSIACAAGFTVAGAAAANADTVMVKSGDTLSQIADENNTTVSSIQSLNSLQNIHLIFPGQKLVISTNNGDAAASTQQSAQTTQQASQQQTTQQASQQQTTQQASQQQTTQQASQQQTTQQASQQQTTQQASQQQTMQTTQQAVASSSEQAARDWIASRESGGSYTAQNGNYYGKYQLSRAYLGGDYSAENQERVADSYVLNRYGSWANAKAHWLQNGWY